MMKIRYNISRNRKIDIVKLAMFGAVLLAISIFFIIFGIRNLLTKDQVLRDAKKAQTQYETRLAEMAGNTENYNKEIRSLQAKWGNRVSFSNALVSQKTAHVIEKLDVIEDLLPEGAYIKDIYMQIEGKPVITITVVSNSYPNLFNVYKNLSRYDPVILNETVKNGIYNSKVNLNIKIDHGKK